MKRHTKKLTLRAEILRDLSTPELAIINGGVTYIYSSGQKQNASCNACVAQNAFIHADPSGIIGGCGGGFAIQWNLGCPVAKV
jgi:hypothetical protein